MLSGIKYRVENNICLYTPRSESVLLAEWFSAIPLFIALAFTVIFVQDGYPQGVLTIAVPMALLTVFLWYLAQRYVARVAFDAQTRRLMKTKKGEATEVFDLSKARRIVSTREFSNAGWKYHLLVEENGGSATVIFDETAATWWGLTWARFARKLAAVVGLPLKEENWTMDVHGNRTPFTRKEGRRQRKYIAVFVPTVIALLGAIVYARHPTLLVFLYAGIVTVSMNMAITSMLILADKNKNETDRLSLVVSIVTTVIPYSVAYLMFSLMLTGFQLPGAD